MQRDESAEKKFPPPFRPTHHNNNLRFTNSSCHGRRHKHSLKYHKSFRNLVYQLYEKVVRDEMMNIYTGKFEPNSSVSTGRGPQTTSSPGSGNKRNSTLPNIFGNSSQSSSKESHGTPVARKLSVQLSKASYGSKSDVKRNDVLVKQSTLYPVLNDPYLQGRETAELVDQDEEGSGSEKVKLKLMSMWNNMKYGN